MKREKEVRKEEKRKDGEGNEIVAVKKSRSARFYERVCKGLCERIPQKKRREKVFPLLEYAGIEDDFDFWFGKRIFLVLFAGLIGLIIPWTAGRFFNLLDFESAVPVVFGEMIITLQLIPMIASVVLGIGLAAGAAVLFYLHLYYLIEGRASRVESILPDFLLLVASNVNAGMTPFSAFRSAARKEFGPLTKEIKLAASRSLGTESFQQALKELSKRIKSRSLEETVAFFSQALRSGGHLSKLLETSANDLRQTQEMRKELLSSTKMYVIFVAFVVVIGAPLLLGVAVQFLDMISAIQGESTLGSADVVAVGFLASEMSITPAFMQLTAYVLLLGNAVLSSMFIGMLASGKAKMGLKYAPVILIVSVIVFIVVSLLLKGLLGGY